ncbi:MAG: methylmalonyl-CoA mutase family protein [Planctomycetia bacterium]|nr:methylmalonyl-CoA mutase family protein [Planctomycetia bacterium]
MDAPAYRPTHPVRFVTAAALFDGHDAAINVIRRLLQDSGAEVIHLGHNRSVLEIVQTAVDEDAQGIAISSYQGGHVEFFKYAKDLLKELGADHVKLFGGGGGVIVPAEIEDLERYGVEKIFSPEDGRRLGLQGMIDHMMRAADFEPPRLVRGGGVPRLAPTDRRLLASAITTSERAGFADTELGRAVRAAADELPRDRRSVVVGVTGTGGAGKSSLCDELVLRFLEGTAPEAGGRGGATVAVLSVDPSRRRTGGALLGDRIRMNSIPHPRAYMRSLATRGAKGELAAATRDAIRLCRLAGFDWIFVETSGTGQGDTEIVDLCDVSVYVMTPEYGAASQLEKIGMLDFADFVAVNKAERRGADDALRDVRKQVRRNRRLFDGPDEALGVFGTVASRFCDAGVDALFEALVAKVAAKTGRSVPVRLPSEATDPRAPHASTIIPHDRTGYLGEISRTVRAHKAWVDEQVRYVRDVGHLEGARALVAREGAAAGALDAVEQALARARARVDAKARAALDAWPARKAAYLADALSYGVRDRAVELPTFTRSLAGTRIPKVALPTSDEPGEVLRFLLLENLPGQFPYTAGVFPFKRTDEDPKRQFAGEGPPDRTNKRFHYLCRGEASKRLSTAFDSVTLYGEDPAERPDIWGKIGESGVSICTLEDMARLYAGFDLCDANTSVSMTINGPAPILLAMYMNTAFDQQVDAFRAQHGRIPDPKEHAELLERTVRTVRGTVQADILKEDQAQNTCIFSTAFALRMMGDIQQWFIDHEVRNYYSVSISGYHIAEAGANPVTQLALTLANGFTYVEYYLARGMKVDDFAPNLSFFFSNGLDPEYTVIGRVARRIWAVAMRDRYGANDRSQKLKYHVQTSGRSLHAQEIQFNDIRTTLQALLALQDHCNSLHTNAYDEAITTPTAESVRRAMAVQLICTKEYGWLRAENALQGSYFVDRLTDAVEEAVLDEFRRLDERGGVLGAMETQYQRGRIQEESLLYERMKHDGSLPIVGVNTFLPEQADGAVPRQIDLSRATLEEKRLQLDRLRDFQGRHAAATPGALERLKRVARSGGNVFAELLATVRVASLGQISHALYEVGGKYRRNM